MPSARRTSRLLQRSARRRSGTSTGLKPAARSNFAGYAQSITALSARIVCRAAVDAQGQSGDPAPCSARLGRWTRTESIAMTYRISYRRHLIGAMILAALLVDMPAATAQTAQEQSRFASGIDEAVKALGDVPRTKKMPPQA